MLKIRDSEVTDLSEFKRFDPTDWKELSRQITWKVINKKMFEQRDDADKIIHINQMDLTLMFIVSELSKNRDKLIYYPLKYDDIDAMNVPEKFVYAMATYNVQNDHKKRIMKFSESLISSSPMFPLISSSNMFSKFGSMGMHIGSDDGPGSLIQDTDELNRANIINITNKYNLHGSTYMFDTDTLNEVANRMSGDFYIIPSSVNEIMCIRKKYVTDNNNKDSDQVEDDLLDMLFQINKKGREDNILSNRIYLYNQAESALLSIKQQL